MRKFISLILVIVMIFSAVACVDLSVFATDISVNNRAQWLSKLTETFDMTVDEDNYPDNYFSDISSDSEYYRDIMVATEFGLVDVEAGGEVDPEGEITREFASHTLNICLGWSLEGQAGDNGEYTFADFEDCIYPDDDQVAVNRAWFALDDSENFLPEQEATAAEIKNMLDDAQATLAEDEVDENYENTFEYKDGVVEIADGTKVEFYDKSIKIFNTDYTIHENDTVVVYSYGIPVIYTAKKVTVDSNCITVQTTEEQTEEAVENVDMQASFDVDATDFIPGEGFEVVDEMGSASSVASAKGKKPKNSIKLSREIPLLAGNKITVDIGIKNIKFSSKENTMEQTISAKLSFDVAFTVGAEFNFTDIDPDVLDDFDSLGTIPIAGIGFVEFKPELNFNGKTSFEQTYNVVVGFSRDSSGTHNLTSFHKGNFTFIFEGSCKFGIKVEAGITIVVVKVGIYGEIGLIAKAQAKRTVDANGNNLFCISLGGYLYLTVGVELKVDVLLWKINPKIEWEIFKEDNSPLRLYFHIENGKLVDKCTADDMKYISPKNTKYGSVATDSAGAYTRYDSNGSFRYSINDKRVTITGYQGSPGNLIIPSTIDGYPVTSIDACAFDYRSSLTSVDIPDSVTRIDSFAFSGCSSLTSVTIGNSVSSIGYGAFEGCSSLTSITIPDSVTSIGREAFYSCSSLTRVNIPNSVTRIGGGAFSGCSSLTSITIPASVTSIDYLAFSNCGSLTSIIVDQNNAVYDSRNNCNAIIESKTNILLAGCKNTVIPDSVTSIGYSAFSGCSSLTSINIPDSVTSIPGNAFKGCSSLTSITIPDSVTSIGDCAFYSCSSLKSITIPDSVTSIGLYAFEYCRSLTSITIPDSVTSIGNDAFGGCRSLTSITIPDSVTSIYACTFIGCSSLTSVTIPASVTSIGNQAFDGCSSLTSINIPDSVTSIGGSAFEGCSSLTSVTIPASVTSIVYDAFKGCSSLTSINIPDSVTSIGLSAFEDCSSLTDVYYTGSPEQWNTITIGKYNEDLTDATIHYNYDPNHVHSYTDVVTSPTCTAKGYTTHTCECGDSYKDTYVNALGHKWDSGKVTKKATPTATGIKTYTCKVCKAKKTATIAKCAKYANTIVVKGKKVNVSFAKLKKANLSIARNSVLTISKAQGKLTYAKTSGNKNITINKTKGTIQIKKGIKKGTYKIGVKVTAAGNASYKSASKTATITVVVK